MKNLLVKFDFKFLTVVIKHYKSIDIEMCEQPYRLNRLGLDILDGLINRLIIEFNVEIIIDDNQIINYK